MDDTWLLERKPVTAVTKPEASPLPRGTPPARPNPVPIPEFPKSGANVSMIMLIAFFCLGLIVGGIGVYFVASPSPTGTTYEFVDADFAELHQNYTDCIEGRRQYCADNGWTL